MGSQRAKSQTNAAAKKGGPKQVRSNFYSNQNRERAAAAKASVKKFRAVCETDYEDAVGDLVINLLHLARQDHGAEFDAESFVLRQLREFEVEEEEARTNSPA